MTTAERTLLRTLIDRARRAQLDVAGDPLAAADGLLHGTRGSYKRGCRCVDCRAYTANTRREHRARAEPTRHGVASSYSNGCRCNPCRTAWRERARARKTA